MRKTSKRDKRGTSKRDKLNKSKKSFKTENLKGRNQELPENDIPEKNEMAEEPAISGDREAKKKPSANFSLLSSRSGSLKPPESLNPVNSFNVGSMIKRGAGLSRRTNRVSVVADSDIASMI